MDVAEADYEIIRGDTSIVGPFQIRDANENVLKLDSTDEMYFTIKKSYTNNDYILQKKLSTDEIKYKNGVYYVILEHNDTAELDYGTYVYDFEIISEELVKTILMGTITLTNEVTHKSNE